MFTPLIDALNETLRVKFHSFAKYALESQPYHSPEQAPLLEALRNVAASDEVLARECARRIETLEGIPVTGGPDLIVTEIAYLDIRRLAEMCLERKRTELHDSEIRMEAVQKAGAVTPEGAEVIAFLEQVVESDKLQIEALERALGAQNA